MAILVTDGNQRATLAVVRSLGRKGVSVTIGEAHRQSLAATSRYCSREFIYPSPETDPGGFQMALLQYLHAQPHEILLPMTDITRDLAPLATVALPSPEVFARAADKGELLRLAQLQDIPIPRTQFADTVEAVARISPDLTYPVVLKPRQSRLRTPQGWVHGGVEYAHSPKELIEKHRKMSAVHAAPLIQERVVGPGCGVFGLFTHGIPKALFAHRRIREKPPSGGVSVLRESIRLDDRLREYSCRLMAALDWHGVAMVEFKIDQASSVPKLMEVNGRFWGSLQLAIDAGIDFPCLLYQVLRGEDPAPVGEYRQGIKTRWFLGDLDHLLIMWLHRHGSLSLPVGYPGRWATLWEFCKACGPGTRSEIWNRDDPGPAWTELRQYMISGLSGIRSRLT